jgi:hypothetical protein
MAMTGPFDQARYRITRQALRATLDRAARRTPPRLDLERQQTAEKPTRAANATVIAYKSITPSLLCRVVQGAAAPARDGIDQHG